MDDIQIKVRNYDLISMALAAKINDNPHLENFQNLIVHDFKEFCDKESGLNDVIALQKLWKIYQTLQKIAICPELHTKKICALGGGFSSGKSAFVNSFIDTKEIRIAEGIKPVTAIPSYVLMNDVSAIQGISSKGGMFNIHADLYKDISHEMLKTFQFNLKDIINYITIFAPMNKDMLSNICIIDTPGYNPPKTSTEKGDFETANKYIEDADFLIWLVGLDSNGTIPVSDIEFLSQLPFGKENGKSLYVIANKAELKTNEDISDILDEFEETLDDAGIQYEGISAYSAKTKKVYEFRKKDIYSFFQENNSNNEIYKNIIDELNSVFNEYENFIYEDCQKSKENRKKVKDILFYAFGSGLLDDSSNEMSIKIEEGLNELQAYFQIGDNENERIQRLEEIKNKFYNCLVEFSDGAIQIKDLILTNDENQINSTNTQKEFKNSLFEKKAKKIRRNKRCYDFAKRTRNHKFIHRIF